MENNLDLNGLALDFLRKRITVILPAQIRSCIQELDEQEIWWRPNDKSNSVGNLVLHVSGSMRHYLSRAIGGIEYERDRPAEFAERGPLDKQRLLAVFDEAIGEAIETLDRFDPSRFTEPAAETDQRLTIFELLSGIGLHLATHTGQIVYVTKMLKEGSLDELWIRAHKA